MSVSGYLTALSWTLVMIAIMLLFLGVIVASWVSMGALVLLILVSLIMSNVYHLYGARRKF